MGSFRVAVSIVLLACCTAGCVTRTVSSTKVPALNTATTQVHEALLLDVGVAVFDAGLEDFDEDADDLPLYPEVRRAEALFMPQQLSDALIESGAWGAVRVVPNEQQLTDLLITGRIEHSDGESLKLAVKATDSRGIDWLDKTYTGKVSRYAYKSTARIEQDPFQAVFNTIANDLLAKLESQTEETRRQVRTVTELRFAQGFSPDAFADHLQRDTKGRYQILRLPALDDPMLRRVHSIRERDHIFVDALQSYYTEFDAMMDEPYHEWRRLSYEEVVAIKELRAQSTRQLLTGVIAVIGGLAAQIDGDSATSRAAGRIATIGGAYILKSGLQSRQETQMHVEALEELGTSLEAEIAPRVIELEDQTVTLSGTVEEQYAQWRELLAEIYRAEIGDLQGPTVDAGEPATL